MKTMGQAIDAATADHARRYSSSNITSAKVFKHQTKPLLWEVVVRADHFSMPLNYEVSMVDLSIVLV